jgi:hypothetical protein
MAGPNLPQSWPTSGESVDDSARALLKNGLASMPELQGMSSDGALAVVKEAENLARDEQDVSLYEKATSAKYVLPFAGLMILASFLGVALYAGLGFIITELHLGRRGTGAVMLAVVIGAYHVFMRVYRWRTPRRMRPYVLRVLKKREDGAAVSKGIR